MNWGEKRYHSLDYELKQRFGEKLYKISLNGNMTCPNRDGTLGTGGCIFCSKGGSGEFASDPSESITKQLEQGKERVRQKHTGTKYIAYFQSFTNTYAPIAYLERIFMEAISHPDVAILSIATRPDCLGDEVLALLGRLNAIKPVWIELGLQTIHEDTALMIRRGYPLSCFVESVEKLHQLGIEIIVHLILGLPGESREQMLDSVRFLNTLPVTGIKLQLLHILKETDLAQMEVTVLSMSEYIDLVISCLEEMDSRFVVHRLTGDGPRALLIAPLWSLQKKAILNQIHHQLKERNTWQGKKFTAVSLFDTTHLNEKE